MQPPSDSKAGRFFELCESRNGTWLSQTADELKLERDEVRGSWQYGKTYSLAIAGDDSVQFP